MSEAIESIDRFEDIAEFFAVVLTADSKIDSFVAAILSLLGLLLSLAFWIAFSLSLPLYAAKKIAPILKRIESCNSHISLPTEEHEALLEDLEDLAAVAERHAEPTVAHAEVIAELKKDGLLSD